MHLAVAKLLLYLFLGFIVPTFAYTQPDISQAYVSTSLLKKYVYTLASDSMQGRQTGTTGQLKAALYCTQVFRNHHLAPVFRLDSVRGTYRQPYTFSIVDAALFGNSRVTYKKYELTPVSLTASDSSQVYLGHNVAGLRVGTDLKQEVLVLSAHYDHLGFSGGRIFHGADDNASGTATVLSIAALVDSLAQQGIRPRRSLLFVLFSGEEGGLLGSDFFLQNSPIPLKQLVCDLNVDMIGRVDYHHRTNPDYCYLLTGEQATTLLNVVEIANKQSVNLALNREGYDTKTDPQQYFYRSDQYNFFKHGIPALFFTSGEHADYHKPSDTADKINYEVLQKRATLIFQTLWRLANS
ncbi:M28 family peptidase [Spirosoma koreense]